MWARSSKYMYQEHPSNERCKNKVPTGILLVHAKLLQIELGRDEREEGVGERSGEEER